MSGLKRSKHLFKKADFESHQCVVVMRNITTSTDLKKGQSAELSDVLPEGLVLLVPEGLCAEGHLVLVRFFDGQAYEKVRNSPRSVQDRAQLLAVTGRVVQVKPAPGQKTRVTLELQQFVQKEWQALLKSFREPKEEVKTS